MKKILLFFFINIVNICLASAQVKNDSLCTCDIQKCERGNLITLTNNIYLSFFKYVYGISNTEGTTRVILIRSFDQKEDGFKVASKERLSQVTIDDVKSIEVSYEPLKNVALYGTSGAVCTIRITLNEK